MTDTKGLTSPIDENRITIVIPEDATGQILDTLLRSTTTVNGSSTYEVLDLVRSWRQDTAAPTSDDHAQASPIEIPASAVGLPRVGHPHATGGLCDLPACNAANYDGHEVWGNATAYARDHHPDGSVCEMFGPCGRDICHKARCAMTDTQGLTSPQIEIPRGAVDAAARALGNHIELDFDVLPADEQLQAREAAAAALNAATPLITAAELERIARGIDVVSDPAADAWLKAEAAGRREVARSLIARAAELKAGV